MHKHLENLSGHGADLGQVHQNAWNGCGLACEVRSKVKCVLNVRHFGEGLGGTKVAVWEGPRGWDQSCARSCAEKPFIYAVNLASRKLWSHPWTPTLVPHFGRPLGGPRGASMSSRVPEIAHFSLSRFPPLESPSFKEDKTGLVAIKEASSPRDMGQWRFSLCKSWMASVGQVTTPFTPISGMRLTSQRHPFSSSSPKAPKLTTSPGQLGKYELRLVPPKEKVLVTKVWAFLSAPLDGTDGSWVGHLGKFDCLIWKKVRWKPIFQEIPETCHRQQNRYSPPIPRPSEWIHKTCLQTCSSLKLEECHSLLL